MVMAPIDFRKPALPKCPHLPIKPGGPFKPGDPIKPGGPFKLSPEALDKLEFAMKDKNRDGQLSLDEWVRAKGGEITMGDVKRFERYDRDNDGSVSQQEYLAGQKFERMLKELFQKGKDGIKDGFEGIKDGIKPLTRYFEADARKAAAE